METKTNKDITYAFKTTAKSLWYAFNLYGFVTWLSWLAGVIVSEIVAFMQWAGLQHAPIALKVIFGLAVLILMFCLVAIIALILNTFLSKRIKEGQGCPLEIKGKVESVKRINEVDVAFGAEAIGNLRVLVKAVFNPQRWSLPITRFVLEISGVERETECPPKVVYKGSKWQGFFEIPKDLEVHNMTVRILAFVGNIPCYSDNLPIPFEKEVKNHDL